MVSKPSVYIFLICYARYDPRDSPRRQAVKKLIKLHGVSAKSCFFIGQRAGQKWAIINSVSCWEAVGDGSLHTTNKTS